MRALSALEKETHFLPIIHKRLQQGQKLLFKPNLVSTENIDPYHFGPTIGSSGNTEWPFVAAVMRWFHDRAGIQLFSDEPRRGGHGPVQRGGQLSLDQEGRETGDHRVGH